VTELKAQTVDIYFLSTVDFSPLTALVSWTLALFYGVILFTGFLLLRFLHFSFSFCSRTKTADLDC